MERQLSVRFANGICSAIALSLLSACGGSSTTQQLPAANQALELVTAPALDSVVDNNQAAGSTPGSAPTAPTEQVTPTAPTGADVAAQIPLTPENIMAAAELAESADLTGQNLSGPNLSGQTLLLNGASRVGCDADAAVFNPTMLALINASRAEARMCGTTLRPPVASLQWNDKLTAAAVSHGIDMTANNFFDHTGSDGLGVGDRATSADYNWRAVGENIAAGQLDQAEVHQSWLDSDGHCDNIMKVLFTEVGAACITDSNADFGTYWVVVFGDSK